MPEFQSAVFSNGSRRSGAEVEAMTAKEISSWQRRRGQRVTMERRHIHVAIGIERRYCLGGRCREGRRDWESMQTALRD